MTIGERIRAKRIELNMTQDELAKKMGYKYRSSVNKMEQADHLTLKIISKVAKALGCEESELMGWNDDSSQVHYIDHKAADAAQKMMKNPKLRLLFEAAADSSEEDLSTTYNMLMALKRKENHDND
ncbi:MAG: helix-turn-helix domain-containing protein [Lachnospiraceae bacterium]|jgi:transcriptional regulator with XRE-family HTH domain|nr:helix-turn-helix domain-containing protein [Lachnospiraceae bacterium]